MSEFVYINDFVSGEKARIRAYFSAVENLLLLIFELRDNLVSWPV